ncbi:MAG: hypothetical protein Q9219_002397 [cf. Caloplaca sp. 3 TL-2023]
MTTTSHPSSSKLTIPATQCTAPVLSFNCLYTHDLRRKAKRWQDGMLRFHTFNKRIMVYDVPRNFVGDTHWREPQPIQDGDELELEKGVLIQVGEEVGRTETDLTELLEKNKRAKPIPAGDQGSSRGEGIREEATMQIPPLATPNQTAERLTASSFAPLRPKSLNALLGRSRGPVGRAALPVKSPADIRRGNENSFASGQRSPKRRRLEYPTRISPPTPSDAVKADGSNSPSEPRTKTITNPSKAPRPVGRRESRVAQQKTPEREANSKMSRDSGVANLKTRCKDRLLGDHRRHEPPADTDCGASASLGKHVFPRKGEGAVRPGQREPESHPHEPKVPSASEAKLPMAQKSTSQRHGHLDNDGIEEADPSNADNAEETEPKRRLRIASTKPRRKLMYRDLLPQNGPPQPSTRPPARPQQRVRTKPRHVLDDFHDAQRDRLQARSSKRMTSATNLMEDSVKQAELPPDRDAEEPAIRSGEASLNPSPTFPNALFLTPPEPISNPPPPRPKNPITTDLSTNDDIPTSTQAARTLSKMDTLLLPSKGNLPAPQPPAKNTLKAAPPPPERLTRPFQRSVSDLSSSKPIPASIAHPPTRRTGLRKALSDGLPPPAMPDPTTTTTTALLRQSDVHLGASSGAQAQVADPWSREAWDLFGFDGTEKRVGTENGIKGGCGDGGWRRGKELLVERREGWG